MDTKRQIVYSPYLNLKDRETFKIGKVEIWNFSKKSEEYITDTNLRQQIQSILQMNKIGKQPIDDIGVVSIGDKDFRRFNESELIEIHFARLILFISFLAEHNIDYKDLNVGHRMATSENFDIVI